MRAALLTVELTSAPLLLLSLVYVLSGYQLLYPDARILPHAKRIHADPLLRATTLLLGYAHSLAGFVIMCERRLARYPRLRTALEAAAALSLTLALAYVFSLDAAYGA